MIEPVYHAYVGTTEAGNYALHEHSGNNQWGSTPDAVCITQDGMAFEIAKRMRKQGYKQASITGCIPSNLWQKYLPGAQRGQGMVEYALILALVVAIVVMVYVWFGPLFGTLLQGIVSKL